MENYLTLAEEIREMRHRVKIVTIIISASGVISKQLHNSIKAV
jgi:hypothetical protein